MNKDQLIALLNNPEFIEKIIQRLLGESSSNHFVRYPRVALKPYELTDEEKNQIKIENEEEDEDGWFDEFEEEPWSETYDLHRRDTLLTGASVAAVIAEHLWGVPAVINDVDLFYYQLNSKGEESVYHEVYENLVDSEFNYRIQANRRKGILNLVRVVPSPEFSLVNILDSFDLSYSKVGIVLGEKKMIYKEDFIDFLLTKNITIGKKNFVDHMLPTFIRGVVKAKDFQASFYLGDYMRDFLEENQDVFARPGFAFGVVTSRNDLTLGFDDDLDGHLLLTEKRLQAWKEDPTLLDPWAKLVEVPDSYVPNPENPNEEFLEDKKYTHRIVFNIPKEPWAEFYQWVLHDYKKKKSDAGSFYRGLNNVRPKIRKQSSAWFSKFKSILDSALTDDPRFWSNMLDSDQEKTELFKESFSVKKLMSLQSFLESHKDLVKLNYLLFRDLGFKISEVIDLHQALEKLPLYQIGIFEVLMVPQSGFFYREENPLVVARKESLAQLLKNKDFKNLEKLIEGFRVEDLKKSHLTDPISIGPFKKWVREICDSVTLDVEGKTMRHCVSGYGQQIKSGKSRIFHIHTSMGDSTLELHYSKEVFKVKTIPTKFRKNSAIQKQELRSKLYGGKFKFSINQHKAVCNTVPAALNLKIGQRLVHYLNGELSVKENKEKFREDLGDFMALLGVFD